MSRIWKPYRSTTCNASSISRYAVTHPHGRFNSSASWPITKSRPSPISCFSVTGAGTKPAAARKHEDTNSELALSA